jgi:hypothetical protein
MSLQMAAFVSDLILRRERYVSATKILRGKVITMTICAITR